MAKESNFMPQGMPLRWHVIEKATGKIMKTVKGDDVFTIQDLFNSFGSYMYIFEENYELAQSTGFTDKDNKELFVGDIVKYQLNDQAKNGVIFMDCGGRLCILFEREWEQEIDIAFGVAQEGHYSYRGRQIACGLYNYKLVGNYWKDRDLLHKSLRPLNA